MEDRIKELAVKAGFCSRDGKIYPCFREDYSLDNELLDFAKLIVRECADVAADHDALDIYEEIREHFGVEE